MSLPADEELLRRYAEHGVEEAFAELVRRHCNLVWAAARRISGNPDTARDVAQVVFCDLARKARQIPAHTVLAGWLYRAACHTAAKHVRGEVRRTQREQITMETQIRENQPANEPEPTAADLQPLLDSALAELSDADRDAVVLRFLSGRSLAEVGQTLGTSEDAAQKRVSRALEKLRETFRRRGVGLTEGLLVAALASSATSLAPPTLAASVTALALAGAGTSGILSALALMKTKLLVGAVGGAVVAGVLLQQQLQVQDLRRENSRLQQQVAALPVGPGPQSPTAPDDSAQREAERAELLRLRGEVARLRQASAANADQRAQAAEARAASAEAAAELVIAMEAARKHSRQVIDALKHVGLAAHVFSMDNQDRRLPTSFDEFRNEIELAEDGTFPGGIGLDQFEFFPHERAISMGEPTLILFREKAARQLPDGTWERNYCLLDGSVQTLTNTDGDFSAFESGRKGTAANAPKGP